MKIKEIFYTKFDKPRADGKLYRWTHETSMDAGVFSTAKSLDAILKWAEDMFPGHSIALLPFERLKGGYLVPGLQREP